MTVDWNLARVTGGGGPGAAWSAEGSTEGYVEPGGAALLGAAIEAVAARLPGDGARPDVRRIEVPRSALVPDAPGVHHSYASWARFPRGGSGGPDAWRVQEFLGLDRTRAEPAAAGAWSALEDDPAEADLVVLDDAGLGFRDDPERWPAALRAPEGRRPWVLLKMARPVAEGPLWEHLLAGFADRLVVVMTVNDLRLTEVQVSRGLSWERTAQDLAAELVSNPRVNSLSHCADVIVSLDTDGALVLSRRDAPGARSGEERRPESRLLFDPRMLEGMWAEEHPGGMVAYTTCLTAGVALELIAGADIDRPDVVAGARRGLAAMRTLHLDGYGAGRGEPLAAGSGVAGLGFPADRIADELTAASDDGTGAFALAEVPPPPAPGWRILEARHPEGLEQLAPEVATRGAEAVLTDVPLGVFGALVTVDRTEIEGFQSIRALIREYGRTRQSKPLSIAVFGPPGAGKSFGVVQVAKSLSGAYEKIEVNLSQLGNPAELHSALHRVRDVGLGGDIPLVFWDEFDTDELAWLRHFLVPMQDGTFQEGEIVHPIGRAIFVFAGGTSKRMADFSTAAMAAVPAKGPDFLSRLKGYVDIIGPNPRDDDPERDPYHLVRRAILLRSILDRQRKGLFERRRAEDGEEKLLRMDSGVLRAFLETRRYKHGARSLESIVAMSALSGQSRFERSSLPAADQMEVHVDAADFLRLAARHEPEEELLETLAEATHARYCARMLGRGYRWNEESTAFLERHDALRPLVPIAYEGDEAHPTLVAWESLGEESRDQNRSQVRSIPSQLEAIGYVMRRARGEGSKPPPFRPDGDLVELLAEREHERWLTAKLAAGWCWAPVRDDQRRRHPDMLPWRELGGAERERRYGEHADCVGPGEISEGDREKDREIAREMGEIVAAAGFEIVRVREPGVVVGVTGHRILADTERLRHGVREALAKIEAAFPGEPPWAISALAEGADRLVAEEVLRRPGGRLIAALPLPASDYENDFDSDRSKRRFRELLGRAEEVVELPPAASREAAYEAAGRHVLDRCDVLLAIWDGDDEQGRGGTGGVVADARRRGTPIAWVQAGNRRPGTEEPTSVGDAQGTVSFEGFAGRPEVSG